MGGRFLVLHKEPFVITLPPTFIITGGTKTEIYPSSKPEVKINKRAKLETRRVRKMFFSVFNYYTKPNKKRTLNRRESENSVKNAKNKNYFVLFISLYNNIKNKSIMGYAGSQCPKCLRVRTKKIKNGYGGVSVPSVPPCED
jgi:hypothetical protein